MAKASVTSKGQITIPAKIRNFKLSMKQDQIREVAFCLNGRADPESYDITESVFSPLDADPAFRPEYIRNDADRKFDLYGPESITGDRLQHVKRWGARISRKKTVKYTGDISFDPEPCLCIKFHRSISDKNKEKAFRWSDSIVNAYRPDAGALTIVPNLPDEITETTIKLAQVFRGSFLSPGTYPKYGPKLGMFTWLSRLHVEAIGLKNLKTTPLLTTEENDYGGVKLILGETQRPWEMDLQTWVNSWHTAMEHLRKFHIFANPKVNGLAIKVYRSRNSLTPRTDGRVRDISSYLAPEDRGKSAEIKPPPTEELIESLLIGDQEKSMAAFNVLYDQACEQIDLAPLLPDPATIDDTDLQSRVNNIILMCHMNENRFEDFLAALQYKSHESKMLEWGFSVPVRAPQFISRLMPSVIEELSSNDPQRVKAAGAVISKWGVLNTIDLWVYADQILPLVGKDEGIVSGLSDNYLMAEKETPLREATKLLDSKEANLRKGAARLLARLAIGQGQLSDLLPLVSHANTSVRTGVTRQITDSLKSGKGDVCGDDFMALLVSLNDRKYREIIANAVTAGMLSSFKATPEVRAAKKLLESNKAEDRAEGAKYTCRIMGDMHDCRRLAALIAQALFDDEENVREAAAHAINIIADLQSPIHVVRATLPCIHAALKNADGDARRSLEYARDRLEQDQQVYLSDL